MKNLNLLKEKQNMCHFFELFDKKSFREMLQDCIQGKDDVEIDLQDIISEQNPKDAVKSILENYNVTPKEREE